MKVLQLSKYPIETPISSTTTYTFNINDTQVDQCDSDKCLLSTELGWFAPEPCELRLACNDLKGNICGDYGYNLRISNKTMPICRPNQLFSQQMVTQDIMKVEFWYTQDVGGFSAQCFLWCLSNEGFNSQTLVTLSPEVSCSSTPNLSLKLMFQAIPKFPRETMKFFDGPNRNVTFGIEPYVIHKISLNWSDQVCTATPCFQQANLAWLQPQLCHFNIMCPMLNGDVCSLAGVDVSHGKNTTFTLCLENRLFQVPLSTHDTIKFRFWQTPLAIYNIQCYAWCENYDELEVR